MFSKKEDFTNNIQFKIGERIYDLETKDYDTVNDLADIFEKKDAKHKWKSLPFLNSYNVIKSIIQDLTESAVSSETDLNKSLSSAQKKEFLNRLNENSIEPIELSRPPALNLVVFLFPIFSVLGTMLISTYLITAKDYSGWTYLSGLIGVLLSVGLIKMTSSFKNYFKPSTLLEYAKSTYIIRYKILSKTTHTREQLTQFLLDELELVYQTKFTATDSIPEK